MIHIKKWKKKSKNTKNLVLTLSSSHEFRFFTGPDNRTQVLGHGSQHWFLELLYSQVDPAIL